MEHIKSDYCTCKGAGTCNGCNLFICKVCNGAEIGLTTECCGRPITPEEGEQIDKQLLDYKNGMWITRVKENEHILEGCCNCTVCHGDTMACNFTRCIRCHKDDSTPEGEEKLSRKCLGINSRYK